MKIGDLSKRIELQSPVEVSDGMGGVTRTWKKETIVWGAIWPTSVTERIQANSPTMTISHRLRIRYHKTLAPSWRIKYGNRYLSVVSIVNMNEADRQQDLLCREVDT